MLERTAPGVFHTVAGQTVTLAAVSRNNNGVSAAAFKYGSPDNLPQRQVQGHPGCTIQVGAGPRTFTLSVFFVPGLRSARYDLCQEDAGGRLMPTGVTASPASGPVVQVQIDGRPRAVTKAPSPIAARAKSKRPTKSAPTGTARKGTKGAPPRSRTRAPHATRQPDRKTTPAAKSRGSGKGRRGR